MARDPYKYYRIEARELLEQLDRGVLDLERAEKPAELVARILRLAHTLKGASRVVKQGGIADLAHTIEEAFEGHRQAAGPIPSETTDAVLRLLDGIREQLVALDEPAAVEVGPPASEPSPPPVAPPAQMMRADIAEMDNVLEGLRETMTLLGGLRRHLGLLDRARQSAERLRTVAGGLRFAAATPRTAIEDLHGLLASLQRRLGQSVDQIERELRQVRDAAERVRLIPLDDVFTMLERTARDAAAEQHKRVRFEGASGDVRLEANVLGGVQTALVQVVRNAVAHGIEAPAERQRLGKPAEGRLTLEVVRRGRELAFVCSDDGRGIDLTAVRRVLARRGDVPASDDALLDRLLQGGVSTSAAVTELSGRGIGLNVVTDAARRLGGRASIRTTPGQGTTVELHIPPVLAVAPSLLLECDGMPATVPLAAVRRGVRLAPEDVMSTPTGDAVVYDGQVIPFMPLSQVLQTTEAPAAGRRTWSAVVVEAASGLAAVGVDRLSGIAPVVLRPLPALAPAHAVIAAASLDADGDPQLALDPNGLVLAAQRAAAPRAEQPVPPPILVVDDSLTTRMLEQRILESAGYEVDVAVSGEEALEKLRRRSYGLMLVDVEMPGMDGFTLVEQLQADAELRRVPAVLVTSRDAPADRERGRAVGARDYIVKSEFDQTQLLSRIRSLLGSA